MGKQVNFYMAPSDEEAFVAFVRSDRDVGIFKYAVPGEDIPFLEQLPEKGEPFWFSLFLWDRDNSPPPILEYVKEQHYFVPNTFASEVIEFSRSHLDEGRLVRGRIWAEMTGWKRDDSASTFQKGESFQKWFDRLANWIKRRSQKNARGEFVMPGATAFVEEGGNLCQAVLGDGSVI